MAATVSQMQARRISLAAQGFGGTARASVTPRTTQKVVAQLAQFQIDSINVVQRAHYLPLFSRCGAYDPAMLDRLSQRAPRTLFEYWGHAASLIDITLHPALRWRMADAGKEAWGSIARLPKERRELVDKVLAEIATRGPITAREIEHDEVRVRDSWGWNWSQVKTACEWLLWSGQIMAADRNAQFERRYDIPEKVLPAKVFQAPTPDRDQAMVELVRRAARALGVASETCLRDYFRLSRADTTAAIASLVAAGELEPVTVAGWKAPCWISGEAKRPRQVRASALICPFDSMIFERRRLRALFDVDYTIEIYVPEAKRKFGYYTYLFLHDEHIMARVDLKADRKAGVLRVQAAWREPSLDPMITDSSFLAPLADAIARMAQWLGLAAVEVNPKGDLAAALGRAAH